MIKILFQSFYKTFYFSLILLLPIYAQAEKTEVKIGVILPLSGGLAHLGESYRDAIQLAISDLPDTTQYKYKVIFEDNQHDLKSTATIANKLINIDSVQVIISMWSNQGKVVSAIAKKAGVIHFGCAWDRTISDNPLSFNLSSTPDYFMHHFVKALEKRNIKNINLIELNDSGSIAAHDELNRQLKDTDIKIIQRQRINSGDRDFRSILTKTKNTKSDVYYLNAGSPELELVVKQMRQIGIKKPVISIGTLDFTTELNLFNSSWYMTMTWPSKDFQDKYSEKFNRPITYQLGNFYDMINIIVYGFETSGSSSNLPPTIDAAKAILEKKSYEGVLGKLTQDKDGTFQSLPSFFRVKNGVRERIPN